MPYTIRVLTLYKDLFFLLPASVHAERPCSYATACCAADCLSEKETLTMYTSGVSIRDAEFIREKHLTEERFCGWAAQSDDRAVLESTGTLTLIPAGKYLFTQGPDKGFEEQLFAAEQLWLESLWLDITFEGPAVYMRKLEEDSTPLFQLFRKIAVQK